MSKEQFRVPADTPGQLATFLTRFVAYVQGQLETRSPDTQAKHSAIVISPDGSAWELTVDDTGTISTTKVRG